MQTKLKIIIATAVCTTIAWVVIMAGFLFLWPSTGGPIGIVQLPRPGDFSLVEWQSQNGEFIIRLVSSNITTSATSVLFSCTSGPPERIWFESLRVQPPKDK